MHSYAVDQLEATFSLSDPSIEAEARGNGAKGLDLFHVRGQAIRAACETMQTSCLDVLGPAESRKDHGWLELLVAPALWPW